ncbi:putative outer membrane transporter protein [Taylorella equigenitalis 14/56]|uniref:Putative outer membrane transporter protein n=1 Tax=Taylorella equigenitalis 14/56 TaxID=1091497 RepID=I7JP79_9BURK|nr:TolC family protein [Taylorella equigenitalis]CCG17903.1 putative outer membrane transporter protein [Taylorella equigenitalis 14/56]
MIKHSKQFILLATCLISACSPIKVDIPESKVDLDNLEFEQTKKAKAIVSLDKWWEDWNDPILTTLIEEGLRENFDIAIAKAKLLESRANANLANADMGPTFGLTANGGFHSTSVSNPIEPALSKVGFNVSDDFQTTGLTGFAGAVASWEPDFFGSKLSDAKAAEYGASAQEEGVHGATLLTSSEIALNYLYYRYYQKKIFYAQRTLSYMQEMRRYLKGRYDVGHVGIELVTDLDSKILAHKARTKTLPAQRDKHLRAIAVLLGKKPQGFTISNSNRDLFEHIPQAPSGQYPISVIERRPDLRAALLNINARASQVASAKADLYPRVKINFLGHNGMVEINSDYLANPSAFGGLFNVGISIPIFTNGRIQRNIEVKDAKLKQAVIEYDQKVLKSLSEVDSVYQAQFAINEQNNLLSSSLVVQNKKTRQLNQMYKLGNKTLDDVLKSKIEASEFKDKILESSLAEAENLIRLYKALGGGW